MLALGPPDWPQAEQGQSKIPGLPLPHISQLRRQ